MPTIKERLRVETILAWAELHFRHHGEWPRRHHGPVLGQPGETWAEIDTALRHGRRGLTGGDSLVLLLRRERGVVIEREAPPKRRRTGRKHLRAEAIALRQEGLTLTAIARRLGCHPTTVHYLVKEE